MSDLRFPPIDRGAQRERTTLSWERTALATVAGSLIVARLSYPHWGALTLVLIVATGLLACWILANVRRTRQRPLGSAEADGRAPLALAVMVALAAGAAAIVVGVG